MNQFFTKFLRQSWLVFVVLGLGLLSAYTSSPIYGAPALTPTPDVQTVPKPIFVDTPANTPFPTPTASNDTTAPGGGGPVATRPPTNNQGDNNDNNDNNNSQDNNQGNNQTESGSPGQSNTTPGNGAATTNTTTTGSQNNVSNNGLTGKVNVVTLNVRKEPGAGAPIVDTLFVNDQVEVRGRDSSGNWWYVCCGAGAQRAGWVSAQFITPTFANAEANTLLPLLGKGALPVATKSSQATPPVTGTPKPTGIPAPVVTPDGELRLTMRAQPDFAWQGQQIQLQLALRNSSSQALTQIQLRNDLPPEVALIDATVSDGGDYRYTGAVGSGPLLVIDWPTLPAQAQVVATLTLQIRTDTPVGALIDNLAAVTSAEGAEALAGLTLAMPPTGLPQFR